MLRRVYFRFENLTREIKKKEYKQEKTIERMRKATFVRSVSRELVCSAMRRRERGFYVTIYKKNRRIACAIECETGCTMTTTTS